MENEKKINWFPGHMAKAMRKTAEDVKLCDGVVYVLDARAPYACLNGELMKVFGGRPIVYALNKSDLITPAAASAIVADFRAKGLVIEHIDGLLKKDAERLKNACRQVLREKTERDKAKGITRTLRFMVAGVPNTGKSTIINTLCGGKKAETGNKAGVTRANKWIRLGGFDLLDTPGTMPPSMENQVYATHLALIGSINDDILDLGDLALKLIGEVRKTAAKELYDRYKIENTEASDLGVFGEICKRRGFMLKGGEEDYDRCARTLIDDFRKGRMGKICLEIRP
ncbi:MAG: ribosome biogenesis GTPase YlqF [Clostridia bacterium]|nr:ribosome biogenesis GTPase YlqF [Clostridia bacterium]